MINWNKLEQVEQLEEINSLSKEKPVVIFKHSTRCSISAASLNRLERKWDEAKAGNLTPYYLDLIKHRDISNEIENVYGIDHESPQVLLIKDGQCVYDNSHFGISFDEIIENIGSVSA